MQEQEGFSGWFVRNPSIEFSRFDSYPTVSELLKRHCSPKARVGILDLPMHLDILRKAAASTSDRAPLGAVRRGNRVWLSSHDFVDGPALYEESEAARTGQSLCATLNDVYN